MMTEDKRYFYATEEFNSVDITVWDLQDRTTWDLVVPSWQTNSGATVHNLFILGDYAHVSYYTDGYVVLDISNPEAPVLAAEYSTSDDVGMLPVSSFGLTICSDMDDGLYVFNFNSPVLADPASFTATAISDSQILLGFATNPNIDNVVIAWNLTGTSQNLRVRLRHWGSPLQVVHYCIMERLHL